MMYLLQEQDPWIINYIYESRNRYPTIEKKKQICHILWEWRHVLLVSSEYSCSGGGRYTLHYIMLHYITLPAKGRKYIHMNFSHYLPTYLPNI